jgi:hypothetical protein
LCFLGCPSPDPLPPEADAGGDRYVLVGEAVLFPEPVTSGAFRWDFGDGTVVEGEGTHTYDEPGNFRAVLEVTANDGRRATDEVLVVAHHPILAAPPHNAGALARWGEVVAAVLPDFDAVVLVDRRTRAVLRHVEVCDTPRSIDLAADRFAVACSGDDTLEVRSLDGALLERIELPRGSRPFGVLLDPLTATLQGRDVLWVDGLEAPLGPDPRGLARSGTVTLVSRHRSRDDAGTLWRLGPDGVTEHDLSRDPGPDSDTGARGVPTYLTRLAISPDGTQAAIVGLQANMERGLVRDGLAMTHDTVLRAALRFVDLDGVETARRSFDGRDFASAAAWSPHGNLLYVAIQGRETVEVLDPWTRELLGSFADVGHAPDGLLVDDAELWVLATLSRELAVYDLEDLGISPVELARIDLRPGAVDVLDAEVLRGKQIFHSTADVRMTLDGYISCASCHLDGDQDARVWDFTDRGEGLRNTISLLGHRGTAQGPIHWSANFDEVQDFENDIRGPMQGAGFLSEQDWEATSDPLGAPKAGLSADLDALAAYVESLARFPRAPEAGPDGAAGEVVFEDAGCVDCHAPPEYTDSSFGADGTPLLHDVGTLTPDSGGRLGGVLEGLDTPTLRGVHASAPYFHDGSAATLGEVLERHAPAGLSAEERDLIEAFLRSLE